MHALSGKRCFTHMMIGGNKYTENNKKFKLTIEH